MGFYPRREEMPGNYRQIATEDEVRMAPHAEEIGNTVAYKDLTDEGRAHLRALMSYDNEAVIIRFAEDQEIPLDESRRIFYGLKQYLAVCVFTGGKRSPAKIIDECWHTFLLHCKDYRAFCDEFLRGFVDHDPATDNGGYSFYPITRLCAQGLFGDLDEDVWPDNHRQYVRCISTKPREAARFDDFIK